MEWTGENSFTTVTTQAKENTNKYRRTKNGFWGAARESTHTYTISIVTTSRIRNCHVNYKRLKLNK